MDYKQTVEYLYNQLPAFQKIGKSAIKPKLTNIIALCELLGNPQNDFPCIHIAGTNGKGSSSHLIASILQEQGYKVGLYTSPHLKDFKERFKISGRPINEQAIIDFVRIQYSELSRIQPSFFEITVAMAFWFFSQEKIDIAVIEVGLGGRFDSTNIISKIASLITNIGYDHQDVLGDTLEEIAYQKAGIIKENTPVIISEKQAETYKVFLNEAKLTNSEIIFAQDQFEIIESDESITSLTLKIKEKETNKIDVFESGLVGEYQKANIIGILALVKKLKSLGWEISDLSLKKGIKNVVSNTLFLGRWQVISNHPLTICDTGHNVHAFEVTSKKLSDYKKGKLHLILGFVKDKKPEEILKLLPINANFYFCDFSSFRAIKATELAILASNLGIDHISTFKDVNEALEHVVKISDKQDIIFIGGSTYLVSELKNL